MKPIFIAEVKTQSPFGWKSSQSWEELFIIANTYGDWISIHTDKRWGGSFSLLKTARSLTTKPILAKGIHATDKDIQRAVDCGADLVLVVGRIPAIHTEKCLIEPLSLSELNTYSTNTRVVWNSRDLKDGSVKNETFAESREMHQGWLCQASNIVTPSDVHPKANAILVGTHLPTFIQQITTT